MLDAKTILVLQKQNVIDWHKEVCLSAEEISYKFIEENNMWNFLLWHEEDIARVKDIDPLRIVEAKRKIDQFNQFRNNAIEMIDEWISTYLKNRNIPSSNALHSETPGMMIDRLSIMGLKRYHMFEETVRDEASADHKKACEFKVSILDEQINDLASCLTDILHLLERGKLKLKIYRQFKMYNDPALNPQLYKKVNK